MVWDVIKIYHKKKSGDEKTVRDQGQDQAEGIFCWVG